MQNVPAADSVESDADAWRLPLRPPGSPMRWWSFAAALLLLGSMALILFTARRSARAEGRADLLARILLEQAQPLAPIDWTSEWQRMHLEARLFAAASAERVPVSELVDLPADDAPGFRFANKHYAITVRPSPRRDADLPDDVGDLPLESLAWPRELVGPAKSVFFHPEDADRAYSRNLHSDYNDGSPQSRPQPGWLHRRQDAGRRAWDYRAWDDERFLVPSRADA